MFNKSLKEGDNVWFTIILGLRFKVGSGLALWMCKVPKKYVLYVKRFLHVEF